MGLDNKTKECANFEKKLKNHQRTHKEELQKKEKMIKKLEETRQREQKEFSATIVARGAIQEQELQELKHQIDSKDTQVAELKKDLTKLRKNHARFKKSKESLAKDHKTLLYSPVCACNCATA